MKVLVGKGASMDVQEWTGTTALMYASKNKYWEVVEVLLGMGWARARTCKTRMAPVELHSFIWHP